MTAVEIIDGLTRRGCTEDCGVIQLPDLKSEFRGFLTRWFGTDETTLYIDMEYNLNVERHYLYVYEERLLGLRGALPADVVLSFYKGDKLETQIFLYEIE